MHIGTSNHPTSTFPSIVRIALVEVPDDAFVEVPDDAFVEVPDDALTLPFLGMSSSVPSGTLISAGSPIIRKAWLVKVSLNSLKRSLTTVPLGNRRRAFFPFPAGWSGIEAATGLGLGSAGD